MGDRRAVRKKKVVTDEKEGVAGQQRLWARMGWRTWRAEARVSPKRISVRRNMGKLGNQKVVLKTYGTEVSIDWCGIPRIEGPKRRENVCNFGSRRSLMVNDTYA